VPTESLPDIEVLTTVQQAFHTAFGVGADAITLHTGPDDVPGWDSMGHVTLITSLEAALGVAFDIDDVMEMDSVAAIVRIVHRAQGHGQLRR
jgi:acyl carrier protein